MLALSVEVWAAVGEWFGAVGTVGAVVVALWISRRDAWRDKARQLRELEQEAFAVAGVIVVEAQYEDPEDWYPNQDYMPNARITIRNLSDEPILYPRLELFALPDGGTGDWDVHTAPGQEDAVPRTTDVLAAGEQLVLFVDLKTAQYPETLRPVIAFTDRHNQRWRRRSSEPPYRIASDDPEAIGGPEWYRYPAAGPALVAGPDNPALPPTQR